jgi:hypothetical protein
LAHPVETGKVKAGRVARRLRVERPAHLTVARLVRVEKLRKAELVALP